jgi:DNA gyrase subunit A
MEDQEPEETPIEETPIEEPIIMDLPQTHSREVEPKSVEDVMEDSYLRYSMSVIVARALPDARDGLKPVHRRILYTMLEEGLRPTGKYRKSANVTGTVMARYHPHGNVAIYDAMVRLAQPWSMRYMLVDGQGNFGSMDGDPPAAERYTEARMARAAEDLLADIEKDTVDFRETYDGERKEPVVLPAKLPNLLLNGQLGIAVGMATNIPPHNLVELVNATIHQIDHEDASLDDLMVHLKGPDFPTGGIVYGRDSLRIAYATGRGGVVVRGVAEVVDNEKGRNQILITEIPYGVNKANLMERIADLVKDKKIVGISDIRDESARGDVKIVIDLKRDAYSSKLLNQLYKLTPLQTSFHYNMLALVDGIQPRILGLQDIIKEHIKHRRSVVRRRTEFELKKAKERAHVLEGLKIALDHILEMQLRRLAGLERKRIEDELAELEKLIKKLETILGDEKEILKIIKEELGELRERFSDERRTKIIPQELGKLNDEDFVPDEQVVITLTTANYIKRSQIAEYKKQGRGGKGRRGMTTREEDFIDHMLYASTHDYILFFTNKGRVFRLRAYEIPATGLNAKGIAIVNLLQLQPEEKVSSIINISKQQSDGNLIMCTVKGVVKKTPFEQYKNVRTTGLIAINLDEGDELKWISMTNGQNEILISTADGQAIRFNEKDARPMGRVSRGVRGIRLRAGDQVIGMDVIEPESNIFVISSLGYGKRTKVAQFTAHARGGVGIRSAVVNSKTGKLIGVANLTDDSKEIIIISTQGQTIRLGLKDISELGRATQGVRVMRLNGDDTVASIALVEKTTDEDIEEAELTQDSLDLTENA